MRKRILSVLLTLAMLLTLLPVSAFAEEEPGLEEADPPEVVENEDEDLVEAELDPDEELYTGDELFALYVDDVFELGQFPNLFATGSERAYEKLKTENQKAAYTEILGKVDDLLNAEKPTATSTEFSISKALSSEAEMKAVYKALKTDHPEKFFWASLGYANSVNTSTKEVLGLIIYVAKEYSAADDYDTTTVDKSKVGAVDTAKTNAAEIVGKVPSSGTDLEKLKYLKDEICKLVEYNNAALNLDDKDYGNPWQLIWVFDNNENTNVVCEGYAKAFQYLCDQVWPGPNAAVQCYTVSGNMIGGTGQGAHMWNIVRIDSKSYLVDVTNCDGNSIGSPDWLFMAGGDEWNPTDGYTFYIPQRVTVDESGGLKGYRGDGEIKYTYGNDLPWDTTILTLAQDDLYKIPYIRYTGEIPETLTVGDEINLTAKLYNAEEGTYTFSSIDNKYEDIGLLPGLTIDASTGAISGTLNAEKKLANAKNEKLRTFVEVKNASNEVVARGFVEFPEVQAAPEAKSIKIYKGETETTTDSLTLGGTATYTAKVLDQNGNVMTDAAVTWSVSDSTKAEVTDGVVKLTGAAVGDTVTVTAKVTDKETVTTSVTITVAAKPAYDLLNVPTTTQTITYGDTFTPAPAIASDPEGAKITYESSDTNIATVDANGKVTAVKVSATPVTITVKAEEGDTYGPKTATYQVTVTAKPLANCTVSDIPSATYDKTEKTPAVTVKDGDKVLVKDTDYTVAYSPDPLIVRGTYTVTITGKGNYSGTVEKQFVITKADVTIKETAPTKTINASNAANTDAAALKTEMALPEKVTVVFGENKEQEVTINWANATPAFEETGTVYTYEGTLETDPNLNTTGKTLTATLTVNKVKATVTKPGAVSHSASEVETNKADLKNLANLPKTLAVIYTPTDEVTEANTPVNITGWTEKTAGSIQSALDALAEDRTLASKDVVLVPAYTLPQWATKDQVTEPELTLTITNKKTATVTISGLADKTYDKAPITAPTVTPAAGDGGSLGANAKTTIVYKDSNDTALADGQLPTNAGTYTVTATYEDDEYLGTKSETVTIQQLEAQLEWTGADERPYDGNASDVKATVKNLVTGDECTVTVEGGDKTNAGDYTATAKALSNPNYKLPAAATKAYKINKATRTLTVTPATLLLTPQTTTTTKGTFTATVGANDDKDSSFAGALKFALSGDTTAVTWNSTKKEVTGTGNGVVTITVSVDATANYEAAAAKTVTVTSVMKPVLGITSVTGASGDQLTASLDGKTIKVTGLGDKTQVKIALELAAVTGVTLTQDPANDALAGSKIDVKLSDGTVIDSYTVNTDGVTAKVTGVEVKTDTTATENAITDTTAKAEVDAVLSDKTTNTVTGVIESAGDKLQAAGNDKKTETITEVEVKVSLNITAKSLTTENSVTTYKIDVYPQYTVVKKDATPSDAPLVPATKVPNEWLTAEVTVSVKLPTSLSSATSSNLFAKHKLANGSFEYLKTTVAGGVASWKMKSFSEVELYTSSKTANVTFRDNGTDTPASYDESNRNDSLPTNSEGTNKWTTVGGSTVYTKVSELLDENVTGVLVPKEEPSTPVTPPSRPSGGGSSSSGSSSTGRYNVSKASGIKNGSVSLSTTNAKKGDTVTITPKPNKGYEVDTITVLDKNGDEIRVREEDGKYTFTMPDGKVTVEATFRKIEDAEPEEKGFVDVPDGAYYAGAVDWAVELGITNGTSETTFSPNAPCTRAQIVTFLWRAAGSPAASGANPFTDVRSGAYYYDAVLWAVEQGITGGTTATTFSPDRACTRAQTVTFLYRYEKSPAAEGSNPFTDVAADAYYYNAVLWAVEKGVTGGTTAATFSPNATCTRGQIVTFLYRDMA